MMNRLCPVCVNAVMFDDYHALSVVNGDGVDLGPMQDSRDVRAGILHVLATAPDPGEFGHYRHRGTGHVYYVFAITEINGEPRCAMHMHIREQSWRV